MKKLILILTFLPVCLLSQEFKEAYLHRIDVLYADFQKSHLENSQCLNKFNLYSNRRSLLSSINNRIFEFSSNSILSISKDGSFVDSILFLSDSYWQFSNWYYRNGIMFAEYYCPYHNTTYCSGKPYYYLSFNSGKDWIIGNFPDDTSLGFSKFYDENNFLGLKNDKLLITKNIFATIDSIDVFESANASSLKDSGLVLSYIDYGNNPDEIFLVYRQKIIGEEDSVKTGKYKYFFITTEDGGEKWNIYEPSMESSLDKIIQMGDTLLAVGNVPRLINDPKTGYYGDLKISTNRGKTWKRIIQSDSFPPISMFTVYNSKTMMFWAGTISQYEPGSGLYYTNDGGLSWTRILNSEFNLTAESIDNGIFENFNTAYVLYDKKILEIEFEPYGNHEFNSGNYKYELENIDSNVIGIGNIEYLNEHLIVQATPDNPFSLQRIYSSDDEGNSWERLTYPVLEWGGNILDFEYVNSELFTATNKGIYRSQDFGSNWKKSDTGITYKAVNSIAAINDVYFASVYHHGIYSSTDYGENWLKNDTEMDDKNITDLIIKGDKLFATEQYSGLFRTGDLGANWTQITSLGTPHSVLCTHVLGDKMFIGTFGSGIFLSVDNGETWEPRNSGLTNNFVYTLGSNGTKLFAGTDNGIFMSRNEGLNWSRIDSGMAAPDIRKLIVTDNYLFVEHYSGKLYRAPLNQFIDDVKEVSKAKNVYDISPNPATDFLNAGDYFGCEYQIIDMLGNAAASGTVSGDKINVSALLPGFYGIVFTKGGTSKTEKFIKGE